MEEIPNDPGHDALQESLWTIRKIFVGLTAVGFTEDQALKVVIHLISNSNNS